MIRVLIAAAVLLSLVIIETSFISSLPKPLMYTPLVLAASIYVIQHRGSTLGIWWLLGYGLYLDIMHIGFAYGETAIYFMVGVLTYAVSRKLFSSRSLYGVIGGGLFALIVSSVLHFSVYFIQTMQTAGAILWEGSLFFYSSQLILLTVVLGAFFFLNLQIDSRYFSFRTKGL